MDFGLSASPAAAAAAALAAVASSLNIVVSGIPAAVKATF